MARNKGMRRTVRYHGPQGGYGVEKTVKQYLTPSEPRQSLQPKDNQRCIDCRTTFFNSFSLYLYGRIRLNEMFEEQCRRCPEGANRSFTLEKF